MTDLMSSETDPRVTKAMIERIYLDDSLPMLKGVITACWAYDKFRHVTNDLAEMVKMYREHKEKTIVRSSVHYPFAFIEKAAGVNIKDYDEYRFSSAIDQHKRDTIIVTCRSTSFVKTQNNLWKPMPLTYTKGMPRFSVNTREEAVQLCTLIAKLARKATTEKISTLFFSYDIVYVI